MAKTESKVILYPKSAEHVQAPAWKCAECGSFHLREESARRCCATHTNCGTEGCPNLVRINGLTVCRACYENVLTQRWLEKPEAEWDGQTPLYSCTRDEYVFDAETLGDWVAEIDMDIESEAKSTQIEQVVTVGELQAWRKDLITGMRLTICERVDHRTFEIREFICDSVDEDFEFTAKEEKEIDDHVNGWIEKHAPKCWCSGSKRPSVESVLQVVFDDA